MKHARNFILMVAYFSFIWAAFFTNSTLYTSGSMGTPFLNGNSEIEDDYKYTLGVRKIALFPYQKKANFYKGDERQLSDNALFGAVQGLEYLLSASSVRTQGHEYIDQEYWLKWSNKGFVTKFKYLDKGSRDLQFASADFRYRASLGPVILSLGGNIKGHPVYGHPAINDYVGYWWDLAYQYGYEDFLVPLNDLNENGEIDSYYEDADYYWEDGNSNPVAYSDSEFLQYHYPKVIEQYNEDNKMKEWQAEASIAIGIDFYIGNDNYYSHIWVNAFPESVGLTEKSYTGDDIQYDIGALVGANLSEHIGVFIEGNSLNYFGREEYNVSMGVNYRF